MGLSFGEFLSGAFDQVNLFDKGKSFKTKEQEIKIRDIANSRQSRRFKVGNIGKPSGLLDTSRLQGRSFADPDFRDAFFQNSQDPTERDEIKIYDNIGRASTLKKDEIATNIKTLRRDFIENVPFDHAGKIAIQRENRIRDLEAKADQGDKVAIDTLALYKKAGILDEANITEKVQRAITKPGAPLVAPIAQVTGASKIRKSLEVLGAESAVSGSRTAQTIGDISADVAAGLGGAGLGSAALRSTKLAGIVAKLGTKGQFAARLAATEIGAEAGVLAQDITAGEDITAQSIGIGLAVGLLPEALGPSLKGLRGGPKSAVRSVDEIPLGDSVETLKKLDLSGIGSSSRSLSITGKGSRTGFRERVTPKGEVTTGEAELRNLAADLNSVVIDEFSEFRRRIGDTVEPGGLIQAYKNHLADRFNEFVRRTNLDVEKLTIPERRQMFRDFNNFLKQPASVVVDAIKTPSRARLGVNQSRQGVRQTQEPLGVDPETGNPSGVRIKEEALQDSSRQTLASEEPFGRSPDASVKVDIPPPERPKVKQQDKSPSLNQPQATSSKSTRLADKPKVTTGSEAIETPPKAKKASKPKAKAKDTPVDETATKSRLLKPDKDEPSIKPTKRPKKMSALEDHQARAEVLKQGGTEGALRTALSNVNSKKAFTLKGLRRLARKSGRVKERAGQHNRDQLLVSGELKKELKGISIDADDPFTTSLLNDIYQQLSLKKNRTAQEELDRKIVASVLQNVASESGGQLRNVQAYKLRDDKGRVKNITQESRDIANGTDFSKATDDVKARSVDAFLEEAERLVKESGKTLTKAMRDTLRPAAENMVEGLSKIKEFRRADGTINYERLVDAPTAGKERNIYDRALGEYKGRVDELIGTQKGGNGFTETTEATNQLFKAAVLSGFSTPQSILAGNFAAVQLKTAERNLGTLFAKGYSAVSGKRVRAADQTFSTANNLNMYFKRSLQGLSPRNIKKIRERISIYRTNAESAGDTGSIATEIELRTGKIPFLPQKPVQFFKGSVFAVLEVMDEGARVVGRHAERIRVINELNADFKAVLGRDYKGLKSVRKAVDDIYGNDITATLAGYAKYDKFLKKVAGVKGEDFDVLERKMADRIRESGGEYAAARNDSWYGSTEFIRKGFNRLPGGGLIAPIVTAPGNVIEWAFDWSPGLGLVKLLADVPLRKTRNVELSPSEIITRRLAAQLISITSLGTAGLILHRNDMFNMEYPTDQATKDKWRIEGRTPYSVKTPLGWMSLGPFLPVIPGLLAGANVDRALQDNIPGNPDPNFGNLFGQYFKNNFDATLEHPFLATASILEKGDLNKLSSQVASGFVPNILKQLAKATDSTTPDPDSWWERVFVQNIPVLRNTIENRQTLGIAEQGRGLGALTPFGFTSQRDQNGQPYKVDEEYVKHYETGRFSKNISLTELSQTSIMNTLPGETQAEKEELFQQVFRGENALDEGKIADYGKQIEQKIYEEWDKFIESDQYKQADSADQKALLIKIKNEVNSAKKKNILLQLGIEPKDPLSDNEKRIIGVTGGDTSYTLGKQEKTRQEQIATIREKIPDLRPAEVQAEMRKIEKLSVEIQFETLGNVVDDYNGLSSKDLGRELQRISNLDGDAAAKAHFNNILAFGDALFESGAVDSNSQKYRDKKGNISYPSGWLPAGVSPEAKKFRSSVRFSTPLERLRSRENKLFNRPNNVR